VLYIIWNIWEREEVKVSIVVIGKKGGDLAMNSSHPFPIEGGGEQVWKQTIL